MNSIIWIVISVITGAVSYTLWGYLWKLLKEPSTPFSKSYLFSMLISTLLGVIIMPFMLNSQNIIDQLIPIIIVGCFSFGFALNAIVNTPLTYYTNKVAELNKLKRLPKFPTSSSARRIIEAIGVIALILAIGGASVFAALQYSTTITASGSITGVGVQVYSDSAGQVVVNNVNWGNIPPGGSISVNLYIKNTGNVPVTLSMQTASWNPASVSSTLTLTWNYAANSTILPNALLHVVFTLTAATNAPAGTNFSFNIIITATST